MEQITTKIVCPVRIHEFLIDNHYSILIVPWDAELGESISGPLVPGYDYKVIEILYHGIKYDKVLCQHIWNHDDDLPTWEHY